MVVKSGNEGRRNKVVWTEKEKSLIVCRAIEVQRERPDLAGLPLLRQAMGVLPATRRRKLIAVTQAPWFEVHLKEEILKRRTENLNDHNKEVVAILRGILGELQALNAKFGSPVPTLRTVSRRQGPQGGSR